MNPDQVVITGIVVGVLIYYGLGILFKIIRLWLDGTG